nr:MAG TPA: Mitochondrial calcium uniporter [Caudoviricetes sp.]
MNKWNIMEVCYYVTTLSFLVLITIITFRYNSWILTLFMSLSLTQSYLHYRITDLQKELDALRDSRR